MVYFVTCGTVFLNVLILQSGEEITKVKPTDSNGNVKYPKVTYYELLWPSRGNQKKNISIILLFIRTDLSLFHLDHF